MIALIVAVAENNVIGHNNQLIWHLPNDLKHFKQLTLGHPIIMGRRTFESIGRPLPGRTNIVVTRQTDWQAPGCTTAYSVPEALEVAGKLDEEVFIIGGGEVYKEALPAVDIIYLTEVHHNFEGEVRFPELDLAVWQEETRERHEPDEKHAFPYSFVTLRRR
jgi:dihydrofolate reductase